MEIVKILGVAFVTAIVSVLLRSTKPELSFAVTITGVIVILMFLSEGIQSTLTAFTALANIANVENGLLKILLKIVGVGYITEFGAGILNDFGSNAIADKVVLGGKLTIITLSLPIIENILRLSQSLIDLL
jgi:stage III sporulation protein AD